MLIRDIIARGRHDGCGGRAGKAELLTGIEGASSRPVRRIVLIDTRSVSVALPPHCFTAPLRDVLAP
jgi:hypothetical protein